LAAIAHVDQRRGDLGTDLGFERAATAQPAAGRRVDRRRYLALQRQLGRGLARVGLRHGGQKRLRVGMQRLGKQAIGWRGLDDPADIHHSHAVADVADHAQVMRDEQIGEAERFLQVAEQVEDLRLNRHVERRHRLVADHEFRADRECAGNRDTLALAAGEFMRVTVDVLDAEADAMQQLEHLLALLGPAPR
jgi:hypothetical protein